MRDQIGRSEMQIVKFNNLLTDTVELTLEKRSKQKVNLFNKSLLWFDWEHRLQASFMESVECIKLIRIHAEIMRDIMRSQVGVFFEGANTNSTRIAEMCLDRITAQK